MSQTVFQKRSFLAAALVAFSGAAMTATTTFEVSGDVSDSCDVSATALAFGAYAPVNSANVDATSDVTVTCSNGTSYDVGLDDGQNVAEGARRMVHGTDTTEHLTYELYSDDARTTAWGDTVGTDTVAETGSGEGQIHTVHGRIPAGQDTAATGAYSDTVEVTVTF